MADIEMSQFLEQWLEDVKSISVDLTPKDQAEITKAGAKVMAEDVDGETNGSSTVGWDNHYHAMNMMRLNDGYRGHPGDHFVTNLQQDKATSEAVLRAESDKYQELINDKKGDDD